MALGVRQRFDADLGLSLTGITGPGGGSTEKPVGLVQIAAVSRDGRVVQRRYVWDGSRVENKCASANAALELLEELVKRSDA